jgi:hypothetical protein
MSFFEGGEIIPDSWLSIGVTNYSALATKVMKTPPPSTVVLPIRSS